MREYLKRAADEIDASIFSGDVLYCPKEREELKMYIGRWQRAIAQQEEIEKTDGVPPDDE